MSGPSIFTPQPIKAVNGRNVSGFAWNLVPSQPLLAVAVEGAAKGSRLEGGSVLVLDGEGEPFEDVVIRTREGRANPVHLAWAPPHVQEGSLLAIGWDDGTVMVWSLKDRLARGDQEQHAPHPVSLLLWSPDAERIISGDARQEGASTLAVWKVDSRGRPSTICPYKRPFLGGITHAIFRTAGRASKLVTSSFATADSSPFYFAGDAGAFAFATDAGQCVDAIGGLGASVAAMLYDEGCDVLVMLLTNSVLATFKLTDNKPAPLNKVKLSMGRAGLQCAIWAGSGHLAVASGDGVLRLHDVAQGDHYNLMLADVPGLPTEAAGEALVVLAHEAQRGVLAAATREGSAVVWRRVGGAPTDEPEKAWAALAPLALGAGRVPTTLGWGPREGLLAARYTAGDSTGGGAGETGGSLCLLPETVLARVMHMGWAAVQLDASTVRIENASTSRAAMLKTDMRLVGVALYGNNIAVWSGAKVEIYEFDASDRPLAPPKLVGDFPSRATAAALWDDHIYLCVGARVEVANYIGSIQASMGLSDTDGEASAIHVAGSVRSGAGGAPASLAAYVAVGTSRGFVKSWDISRQEPRQHARARRLVAGIPAGGGEPPMSRVTSVSVTADGSRIAATVETQPQPSASWSRSASIYVYVVETDQVQAHDFGPAHRLPARPSWDGAETRLLAVETRPSPAAPAGAPKLEATTLFSTPEQGLKVRDSVSPQADAAPAANNTGGGGDDDHTGGEAEVEGLLGIAVPHLYLITTGASHAEDTVGEEQAGKGGDVGRVQRMRLREFAGMPEGEIDAATSHALIAFSYHLTVGEMDEAHRAVKKIKAASVWENMARMCVQTRRIDVAEVCLGNMGHARGARALREAIEGGADAETCAGVLAVQLGQLQDAERMYEASGRHDLLNELRQAQGDWDSAISLAEAHDRIHLRTTHYVRARGLEAEGMTDTAIEHYQKAGTHRTDVPRMLFDLKRTSKLLEYIDGRKEPELYKWWAQYCESHGQFDRALDYYQHARDHLSIVRVLCFHGKTDAAAEVVHESGDAAAAYHLAKHCEECGRAKEAVFFYQRAGRFSHAVRMARDNDMASELSNLSMQAPAKVMVQSARYFEDKGQFDQAAKLYQRGGNMSRALELCFAHNRFQALREIADELSADTDPALLKKVGDFFIGHKQYDKAVRLFTIAGEAHRALELISTHNIPITEEVAEALCPEQPAGQGGSDEARVALLLKVAKACKRQGNYHLACKKYTQAGDKVKGMKCLLKSGDTDKIIFFAGVSRTRDIYILAANYLQNLDWHSDAAVMKNIVAFYTKAKAFENLASFYDMCAQVEIDEYRDYEKAVAALREALAHLSKARNAPGAPAKAEALQAKVDHVDSFVAARKLVKSNPEEMVRRCNALLDQPGCDQAIRVGDVYALMVEWYYSQQQLQQAHALVERMRGRAIILSPYLDAEMVSAIYGSVGMPPPSDGPAGGGGGANGRGGGGHSGEMDDEMDEDILDGDDDDE